MYLSTGPTAGTAQPETEERDLVTRAVPLAEVERMIRDRTITGSITVAAVGLLRLSGLL